MGLIASAKGSIEPVPEGMHHAVCQSVIDLGHHNNEKFNKLEHKIILIWELPDLRLELANEDGSTRDVPKIQSKEYTLSLHEKAHLRKHLQSWRAKAFTEEELNGFDIKNLLEVNCYLQIIHNKTTDATYANIETITPLPKGMERKSPENPAVFFSFAEYNPGDELPAMPEWIMNKLKKSNEWFDMSNPGGNEEGETMKIDMTNNNDDDEIPF